MLPGVSATAPEGFTEIVRRKGGDPECSFSTRESISSWKLTDSDNGKKACIGWVTAGETCKPWKEEVFNDLKEVVKKQATTDGQLKSSKQGHWLAGWQLGSSATADRKNFGDKFAFLLDDVRKEPEGKWKQGFKRWYYSYDSNFIVIDWNNGWSNKCEQEA
ncbi:hypothetical protein JX265_003106 [Neoarthrinium moseri]|uniref:Uncharacterized protein n=1 Tax=Neoarthrinium moseri TaxID=1658444 RepID=A0A9P9WTP3_9PEZI|nr:uncharacterized protein JN550_011277 [Neoarthrinium moseri]KAI1852624.1 hypothetical protein JX266_002165 [Neoarthrinium moseri]KAI1860815.1 hypothetical protein JN550_011277 [Neoarthrinium moseri]KAI1878929.1 hypothetical protein JX265_003106 [Neoarthrinium moseri]